MYDTVKEAILSAYKLVPEAYRLKSRGHRKAPSQTHVEFARDKGSLFDCWCSVELQILVKRVSIVRVQKVSA